MRRAPVNQLFYITHIKNIPSILEYGILSHEQVESQGIPFEPIYDAQIVAYRRERTTPEGKSLWNYTNLFFQPRNPMLYRVACEKPLSDIVILALRMNVMNQPNSFISTGNAASPQSEIIPVPDRGSVLPDIRKAIDLIWWKEEDGSKRKIMAECLIPDRVPPEYIEAVYVANHGIAERVKELIQQSNIPVIPEPGMFFQPSRKVDLTETLSIVQGDMFFSRLQTLTVSVNTVGVMGKGLASRAKYQFPDVYVEYQDLCRKKILKMGQPYLYKRELSFDYQLADDPMTFTNANLETWFLLFPTKRHWKEPADLKGIEQGLEWIRDNYRQAGIKQLALPALGCGLGWLKWRDVGPLICRYMAQLDIPVWVYLPAEGKLREEETTREFLIVS